MVLALLMLLVLPQASSAGDPSQKQAKEQLKFGIKAAKRGYWLEALDRFQRVNTLVPNRPNILNNIAVAQEAAGLYEDALITYETALALDPNDRVLRRNYSLFKEFYQTNLAPSEPEGEAEEALEEGEERASAEGTPPEAAEESDDEQP